MELWWLIRDFTVRAKESWQGRKEYLLDAKDELSKKAVIYTKQRTIKNHDLVVAEELRSKNLLKNHALSQAISDVGWRTFLNMLAYKAELYGKQFITIDPKYTTQRYHHCGSIMGQNGYKKLTLKDRKWTCPSM